MGYSPAERDMNNKTARDIAEENNRKENVEAIGKKIICLPNEVSAQPRHKPQGNQSSIGKQVILLFLSFCNSNTRSARVEL